MNKRIFRSIVHIALALILAASCMACGGSSGADKPSGEAKPQKSAAEIYQDVLAVSGFGNMTPVPKRDYLEIYNVDANKFVEDDYVWYVSDNPSLNADEIAIFHLEREEYDTVLIDLLEAHIQQRYNVAETYSPEEAAKLENVRVMRVWGEQCGTWVYFCVGSEYSKMMEVIANDLG